MWKSFFLTSVPCSSHPLMIFLSFSIKNWTSIGPVTSLFPQHPCLYLRPVKSARGGHASLGQLRVPISESLHRETLNTSIPTSLSLPVPHPFKPSSFKNITLLTTVSSLCPPQSPIISPNCLQFFWGLISGFLTVKEQVKHPHNRSRALSLIAACVYCRISCSTSPQEHFPTQENSRKACMCIFTHTDLQDTQANYAA